ncbi:MAG: integrase arm-type DNA-binding domain-containing protein [Gammaproteobacteria bacterium]
MLTDTIIRASKAADKPQKLFDGNGLFLLVTPAGGRLWRFKYHFPRGGPGKKEKSLAFGVYPDVSLKEARADRDEARRDLRHGIDPGVKRRAEAHSPANSFKAVASELLEILTKASLAGVNPPNAASEVVERTIQPHRKRKARRREPISADTIETMKRRLETHVFPSIGGTDVSALTGPDVLAVLRRIESRGTFELAHRVRSICSRVLRYARATGRKCEDVAADLIGLLIPVEPESMAAIVEPIQIGQLLRAMSGYAGEPLTRLAMRLVPYIFPRPIEFRMMEWANVTLDGPNPEWRVPWRRMKMRQPHIVPLSRQAVAILREVHRYSGGGRWVFPQLRHPDRPMSENCITAGLRAIGYSGAEQSWHGFRALASTQLNELGWNDKWVEMQLAHSDHNKVRKVYNHAKYLPQRRAMMQSWADYVDALRENTDLAIVNHIGRESVITALKTIHLYENSLLEVSTAAMTTDSSCFQEQKDRQVA